MLAQLPSALEAFDEAGSVFLPPDPNADHDDDDDSFASQDTLLEDARTKHKRLARQRLEAASRDAKPVKTMPLSKPIVQKTPKKVQPPTPSVLTLAVSYTHLRAHETCADLVCRLLLEKKK